MTVNAAIPSVSTAFLVVDEAPDPGSSRRLFFDGGGTSVPLANGLTDVDITIRQEQGSGGSRASLKVQDAGGAILARFDARLVVPDVPALQVVALTMSPNSATAQPGAGPVPYTVGGILADGRVLNLTSPSTGTTYQVEDPSVASVDAEGRVTGVAGGRTGVVAFNHGMRAQAGFAFQAPAAINDLVALAPYVTLTAAGAHQRLTIAGRFSDRSARDVTIGGGATYTSSDPTIVTVDEDGMITSVG